MTAAPSLAPAGAAQSFSQSQKAAIIARVLMDQGAMPPLTEFTPPQQKLILREMSRLIRQVHPTSNIKPYEICNVADIGDAPVNPLDMLKSVDMIQAFYERVHAAGITPLSVGSGTVRKE